MNPATGSKQRELCTQFPNLKALLTQSFNNPFTLEGASVESATGVVLELERHLKRANFGDEPTQAVSGRRTGGRPDTSFLVEAVSRAAASMSDKNNQIEKLESSRRELEDVLDQVRKDFSELTRQQHAFNAQAALEIERVQRAEAKVAWFEAREERLIADLEQARSDRDRLAEAILDFLPHENEHGVPATYNDSWPADLKPSDRGRRAGGVSRR